MTVLNAARDELIRLRLTRRGAWRYQAPDWPPPIARLGEVVYARARAEGHQVGQPRAALVNWNGYIQPHRDRTMPYPALNGVVIFRKDATGGWLRIGQEWHACLDGDIVVFDGSREHEVTPVEGDGYRASILYYLPWGDT